MTLRPPPEKRLFEARERAFLARWWLRDETVHPLALKSCIESLAVVVASDTLEDPEVLSTVSRLLRSDSPRLENDACDRLRTAVCWALPTEAVRSLTTTLWQWGERDVSTWPPEALETVSRAGWTPRLWAALKRLRRVQDPKWKQQWWDSLTLVEGSVPEEQRKAAKVWIEEAGPIELEWRGWVRLAASPWLSSLRVAREGFATMHERLEGYRLAEVAVASRDPEVAAGIFLPWLQAPSRSHFDLAWLTQVLCGNPVLASSDLASEMLILAPGGARSRILTEIVPFCA
jgi:hypothetical protein